MIHTLSLLTSLFLSNQSFANSGFCLECMGYYNTYQYGPSNFNMPYMTPGMPMGSPWWNPYGMYNYTNWQSPGMWQNYPPMMAGSHYPGGGGGVGFAKPNIYLSGKEGTQFEIKLDLKGSTLWVASPSIRNNSWKGSLGSDGDILIENATYPFIYYDYLGSESQLQKSFGFCGSKDHIINKMTETLDMLGFKEHEINDFREHWPTKLPKAEKYCVFPQEDHELKNIAKLQIEPTANVVRINFLVFVDHSKRPAPKPKSEFIPMSASRKNPDAFELREWGIGFEVSK